jgi:AraC-like DNA-binding protein
MKIEFKHIEPHNLLRPYIDKMWIFESSGKLPTSDLKLVVPNGNIKLSFFSANGITASFDGKTVTSKEGSINLTGVVDMPLNLDTENDTFTQTIGVEFNPKGAYRFFQFNLSEVRNDIIQIDDILGLPGKQLEQKMADTKTALGKIEVLQQFLIKELMRNGSDLIFEFCVDRLLSSRGTITIKELEKKTGYSSRWLNMKFMDKIGVSPKNLASIIRFRECYKTFTSGSLKATDRNDYYDFYHDQSHFIKNFKQFTGFSPTGIEPGANDFGRKFYQV